MPCLGTCLVLFKDLDVATPSFNSPLVLLPFPGQPSLALAREPLELPSPPHVARLSVELVCILLQLLISSPISHPTLRHDEESRRFTLRAAVALSPTVVVRPTAADLSKTQKYAVKSDRPSISNSVPSSSTLGADEGNVVRKGTNSAIAKSGKKRKGEEEGSGNSKKVKGGNS
ncbi:hypothetical protein HDU93_000025 [Gonapodya sp. JEL0774]|nr:hypothetical protein HDU93_000025 [Gonapodya sp. JEL0774]